MKIFVKDFSTTMYTRMLIFGMQTDDDLFYHGIDNHPSFSGMVGWCDGSG